MNRTSHRRLEDDPKGEHNKNGRSDAKIGAMEGAKGCRRRLGVTLGGSGSFASTAALNVQMARYSGRTEEAAHHISFTLADEDVSDSFAVKILNDDVYGTPLFHTMGGISFAPGETGTTKVDSLVTIEEIKHYCPGSLWCQSVAYGGKATIGVVIQNLSPLRQGVTYTLSAEANTELPWQDGKEFCGEPGYAGGLEISSLPKTLSLEYGQTEIILELEHWSKFDKECLEFNDIKLSIVSSAEDGAYQYRTKLDPATGDVSVVYPTWDEATGSWEDGTEALGDAHDDITFSVSWAAEAFEEAEAAEAATVQTRTEASVEAALSSTSDSLGAASVYAATAVSNSTTTDSSSATSPSDSKNAWSSEAGYVLIGAIAVMCTFNTTMLLILLCCEWKQLTNLTDGSDSAQGGSVAPRTETPRNRLLPTGPIEEAGLTKARYPSVDRNTEPMGLKI
jgi:hypothetical protein